MCKLVAWYKGFIAINQDIHIYNLSKLKIINEYTTSFVQGNKMRLL